MSSKFFYYIRYWWILHKFNNNYDSLKYANKSIVKRHNKCLYWQLHVSQPGVANVPSKLIQ